MSEKEWAFDRYRDRVRMAQGCRVHASTKDEAIQKARQLFDYEDCMFVERAEPSPEPEGTLDTSQNSPETWDRPDLDYLRTSGISADRDRESDAQSGNPWYPTDEPQPVAQPPAPEAQVPAVSDIVSDKEKIRALVTTKKQGGGHGIQTGPINSSQAIEGLTRIFGDLQHDFHDQWDWMNAEFYLNILCTELDKLRARVAILDAQEVKLPELDITQADRDRSDEANSGWDTTLFCRERQLLDALRAVQAWREVAHSYRESHQNGQPYYENGRLSCPCEHCAAYDALAREGE